MKAQPQGKPVAAWRAPDRNGVGHAFERRRSGRTYCDLPTWSEARDWPIKSRCANCERIVNEGGLF